MEAPLRTSVIYFSSVNRKHNNRQEHRKTNGILRVDPFFKETPNTDYRSPVDEDEVESQSDDVCYLSQFLTCIDRKESNASPENSDSDNSCWERSDSEVSRDNEDSQDIPHPLSSHSESESLLMRSIIDHYDTEGEGEEQIKNSFKNVPSTFPSASTSSNSPVLARIDEEEEEKEKEKEEKKQEEEKEKEKGKEKEKEKENEIEKEKEKKSWQNPDSGLCITRRKNDDADKRIKLAAIHKFFITQGITTKRENYLFSPSNEYGEKILMKCNCCQTTAEHDDHVVAIGESHDMLAAVKFLVDIVFHLSLLKLKYSELGANIMQNQISKLSQWLKKGCLHLSKEAELSVYSITHLFQLKTPIPSRRIERLIHYLWQPCCMKLQNCQQLPDWLYSPFVFYTSFAAVSGIQHEETKFIVAEMMQDPSLAKYGGRYNCKVGIHANLKDDSVKVEILSDTFHHELELCQTKIEIALNRYGFSRSPNSGQVIFACVTPFMIAIGPRVTFLNQLRSNVSNQRLQKAIDWTMKKKKRLSMDDEATKKPVCLRSFSYKKSLSETDFTYQLDESSTRQLSLSSSTSLRLHVQNLLLPSRKFPLSCRVNMSHQSPDLHSMSIHVAPRHDREDAGKFLVRVMFHLHLIKQKWSSALSRLVEHELREIFEWQERGCISLSPGANSYLEAMSNLMQHCHGVTKEQITVLTESLWRPVKDIIMSAEPPDWLNQPLILCYAFVTKHVTGNAQSIIHDNRMNDIPTRCHCHLAVRQSLTAPGAEVEIFVVPFLGNPEKCLEAVMKTIKDHRHFVKGFEEYFAVVTKQKVLVAPRTQFLRLFHSMNSHWK